jgi:hypothetical protein
VYYDKYLYVLGGTYLCERYSCEQDRWEIFGKLPGKHYLYCDLNAVLMEATQSIYMLGGRGYIGDYYDYHFLDLMWRLDLVSLEFELLSVKLPSPKVNVPCFVTSRESTTFYLLLNQDVYLCSPSASTLQRVSSAEVDVKGRGPCYYQRGTLYCVRRSFIGVKTYTIEDLG